jgi:hypothetical protein
MIVLGPHRLFVPEADQTAIGIKQFCAISPVVVPWVAEELDAPVGEFTMDRRHVVDLEEQVALGHIMALPGEDEREVGIVFQAHDVRVRGLELNDEAEDGAIPFLDAPHVTDVDGEMVELDHRVHLLRERTVIESSGTGQASAALGRKVSAELAGVAALHGPGVALPAISDAGA